MASKEITLGSDFSRFEREARALEDDLCGWLEETRDLPERQRHSEIVETLEPLNLSREYLLDLVAYAFRRLDDACLSGEQAKALENYLGPVAEVGIKHCRGQSQRATKPRRDADLTEKIEDLARKGLSAKEAWRELITWMDARGMHPREDDVGLTYEATKDGSERTLKLKSFPSTLSAAKNRMRKKSI